MQRILLATDFSTRAEIARQHAEQIAARAGVSLVVVHAVITETSHPSAFDLMIGQAESFRALVQEQLGARRAQLEDIAQEMRARGLDASADVVEGPPARAICAAAKDRGADLVIVGSHGHTGFKRLLLGSVAERVVRLSPCSVLVAREPLPEGGRGGFRRVLVPTDFSPQAQRAMAEAVALSAPDAEIDVMHSWYLLDTIDASLEPGANSVVYASLAEQMLDAANQHGKALLDRYRGTGRTLALYIAEGRPAASVQRFIESREPYDLIAVGTHGRTGLGRLFLGSVAEATVRHSPCSVLVSRTGAGEDSE